MLMNYLTELKKSLSADDFNNLLVDVERDIKFNRVQFGKRTNQKEFINLCEIMKGVMSR